MCLNSLNSKRHSFVTPLVLDFYCNNRKKWITLTTGPSMATGLRREAETLVELVRRMCFYPATQYEGLQGAFGATHTLVTEQTEQSRGGLGLITWILSCDSFLYCRDTDWQNCLPLLEVTSTQSLGVVGWRVLNVSKKWIWSHLNFFFSVKEKISSARGHVVLGDQKQRFSILASIYKEVSWWCS